MFVSRLLRSVFTAVSVMSTRAVTVVMRREDVSMLTVNFGSSEVVDRAAQAVERNDSGEMVTEGSS